MVQGEFHGSDVAVKVVQFAHDKHAEKIEVFAREVALMTKLHQCVDSLPSARAALGWIELGWLVGG